MLVLNFIRIVGFHARKGPIIGALLPLRNSVGQFFIAHGGGFGSLWQKIVGVAIPRNRPRHQVDNAGTRNVCSDEREDTGAQPCCVDQVEVDFQELGWDFILSPRSLTFSYCRGSCNPHLVRPALFTQAASQILYVREKIFEI